MRLSELFVSHKQVEPVSFEKDTPDFDIPIYYNRARAQQALSPEAPKEDDTSSEVEDMTTWSVAGSEQTPGWSVRAIDGGTSKKPSSKLESYRRSEGYSQFKSELDKFIQANPNYSGIKDSLDYLAALESGYNMGVKNSKGSSALGWFQFLDNTRSAYNKQSRSEFANDAQAQLLAAAQHYTKLQDGVRSRGGNADDFVTMYGAWWRPQSAYEYIKDNNYDYKTKYGESFSGIRRRAEELFV